MIKSLKNCCLNYSNTPNYSSFGQNKDYSKNSSIAKYENKKSLYYGLAIAGTLTGLAALLAFHKPANTKFKNLWNGLFKKSSKVAKAEISETRLDSVNTLFNKLKNLRGMDFAMAVVDYRAEEIGLKGIKFDIIPVKQSERLAIIGDPSALALCDARMRKIYVLEDVINGGNNKRILGILAHEMEHVNQECMIVRTRSLGLGALAKAEADRYVAFLQSKNPAQQSEYLMTQWKRARSASPEQFEQIRKAKYNEYLKEFSDNEVYQAAIKNKGIIEEGTNEAQKAKLYLKETVNQPTSTNSQEYLNSITERDAYDAGNKYERTYEAFLRSSA